MRSWRAPGSAGEAALGASPELLDRVRAHDDLETKEYDKIIDRGGGPAWLCDGQTILYTASDGPHLVDIDERKPKLLLPSKLDSIVDFTVSADERWIYLLLTSQDDDIWLAELE